MALWLRDEDVQNTDLLNFKQDVKKNYYFETMLTFEFCYKIVEIRYKDRLTQITQGQAKQSIFERE